MAYLQKRGMGGRFRQKSLALLHSDTAFQHYYLLDTMRSDFKMLVTSDYKRTTEMKEQPSHNERISVKTHVCVNSLQTCNWNLMKWIWITFSLFPFQSVSSAN